ncbi:MAG TPA: type II toxin-antitoxin system RelE/ParE family toxin [Epulopiscium sp.]|nr:type II toxin-antitoxin system RelE/ParE family toxin [Candidatus Epulonipiscium sp.]
MAIYKVRIYPTAQNDFKEIIEYLNTLSPQAAIKYYDLMVEKINSLSEMPERCPRAKDSQLRIRGYRTLIIENYIVFYVIKDDTVKIHRILYGRRQYNWLL